VSADSSTSKGAEDFATSKGDEGCVTSKGAKILDNGRDVDGIKRIETEMLRQHRFTKWSNQKEHE